LAAAAVTRRALAHRHAPKILAVVGVLLIVAVVLSVNAAISHSGVSSLEKKFDAAVAQEQYAKQRLQLGDHDGATQNINGAERTVASLQQDKHATALEQALKKRKPTGDKPQTVSALAAELSALADLADGVTTVATTKVCDTAGAKVTRAAFAGGRLVIAGNNYLAACDPSTGKLVTVSSASFGDVSAVTPSTSGDSVFILTTEPSVWLYRPTDGSLVKQVASGGWDKGKAIASYNSNLYLLNADSTQIYRYVPVLTGYSVKSAYLAANADTLAGSDSLAIDGSIYALGGGGGLKRYLAGKLDSQLKAVPSSLDKSATLVSINSGANVIAFDSASNRIGVFNTPDGSLTYSKQYKLKDQSFLSGGFDTRTNTVYAVTGTSVVKFPLQ
jgi:hypothetical protein